MWYVYILRSSVDNNIYVGSTNNISRRLNEHNSGKVDSTRNRMPLSLRAYFAVNDRSRAIELENYLKTGSGRAFFKQAHPLAAEALWSVGGHPLRQPALTRVAIEALSG